MRGLLSLFRKKDQPMPKKRGRPAVQGKLDVLRADIEVFLKYNFTQKMIAECMGVSQGTISNYIRNKIHKG